MTTILSYTDLLLSETVGILGDVQRKFLLRIKAGAERVVQMIGDLTQEAGIEERWTSPQRQVVDVGKLVESVIAGSHVQLEDKDLRLILDLPDNLPAIQADPDYLRRVLSNLISNACLASTVGGEVRIQAIQSEGGFSLTMGDQKPTAMALWSSRSRIRAAGCRMMRSTRSLTGGAPARRPSDWANRAPDWPWSRRWSRRMAGGSGWKAISGIGATFSVVLPIADGRFDARVPSLPLRISGSDVDEPSFEAGRILVASPPPRWARGAARHTCRTGGITLGEKSPGRGNRAGLERGVGCGFGRAHPAGRRDPEPPGTDPDRRPRPR